MSGSTDIVSRITQNISGFQYSKVNITGPTEVVTPAARVGDIINHTSFWAALAGAVVGAVIAAGVFALASVAVAAVGITGGIAAPVAAAILGTVGTIALSGGIGAVTGAVTKFVDEAIGGEPSGPIVKGSSDVNVNGKPLAMVDQALSVACTRHSPPQKIAQGSKTVTVNNQPVARKGDKTECSATIAEGSPDVFIGSGQETYVEMKSEFTGWQRAILFAVDFVIPPTAIFSKGLFKGLSKIGKIAATKGARAGAAVAARMAGRAAKGLAKSAARKAKNAARLAKAAGRGAVKGAKAVGRGVAKGAKAVGRGLGKGAKQAGKIARGKTLGCAKNAFKNNKGFKRFTEAGKKFIKGDPIDVLTGHVVEQRVDFTLGQTLPLSFIRTWSRHKDENQSEGLCGAYWTDNFSEYAEVSDNGQLIKIATFEGTYLRFALPHGSLESFNPDHPQYALIRHREYLELFNRDTRIAKLFYFIDTPEIDDADDMDDDHADSEAALTYPPLTDGRYLISAWLDTFDNVVQFHYNEQSWLESVSHTDGMILTLDYQGEWLHSITRVDNGQQQVLVTYTQNEHGQLIESDALLDYHLFYTYDNHANLTRWEDKDHTWVDYHYDAQGRVIHSHGADGFYPVWFDYADNQTRVRDSKGNVTVYDFDPHIMKPLAITSPNGAVTRFTYDLHGNLLNQTFTDGTQVSFSYLEQTGLVTAFTDPMGYQWQYAYNEDERLVRIEDPIGRVWTSQEEKTDENATALFTAPDGSQTAFVRNEFGLLTHVVSKSAQQSARAQLQAAFRYDPRHRLIETQDAEQRRIQLTYNGEDQISQLQSAGGKFWQYGYSRHQKLAHIHRPNQSTESQTYDRHGNLVKYTDANGVIWQLKYGAFDLLREKIDGEGNVWCYDYDKDSLKLSRVTNPKGEHYTYTFNADGQVESETDFAGNQWHYTYYPNGSLQTLTDGEGNQTHYTYNANGQLIQLNTSDDAISYTYDKAGRVTRIQSTDSTLTYVYDINDRVIEETQNTHKIHRTFDEATNTVTRRLYPNGQQEPITTTYKYNNVGELVELTLPNWDSEAEKAQTTTSAQTTPNTTAQVSALHKLTFLYDEEGNEISRLSNLGFILNQQFNEMNLPIRQRAGHEPRTHFDTTELRLTGIDGPSFAELNRTYQYDKALNTIAA
ncbi:PAAR domain-containing protein, partial [Aggregatibacter kilianii]|uniref:PAAR domain-containing protein n=1 Tax=Aggregatibacter kilianii TaxID=2025884 RepID=UPI000D65B46E